MKAEVIDVLRADPDLAAGVDPRLAADAVRSCRAQTLRLPAAAWDAHEGDAAVGGYGLLLLEGFMVRHVGQGGRSGAELLGPGDLLRPWQTVGAVATQPFEPAWEAISPARMALLDARFAAGAAPFPSVAIALLDRVLLRSRHLALSLAIVQQPRVDRRLHLLFWQLADRWGRIGSEGVTLEVPLTHALLGELVAAQRPSVTSALSKLSEKGCVERSGHGWLLRGGPPPELGEPASEH